MEELASVYTAIGDQVNASKYLNKIDIVKNNIETRKILRIGNATFF